jgi:mannose-6-phosphate isomerase-like protein (cupin superfamily)
VPDDEIHEAAAFAGSPVIPLDDLEHTRHAHEVEGAALDPDVTFSVILVHSRPGVGPKVHRHPYPEVFVVESGEATFRLGEDSLVVAGGHLVVAPSGVAHGFTNTGDGELRLTAIHGAGRFDTEWLEGDDPAWTSKRPSG